MQRHSSNESKIPIPPNLLKNFNVYEILEPEKNGVKNCDCSQDSGFQDSDLGPAFLDKNRDFDLVDLYQNILVSPQHIKKNEPTDIVEVDGTLNATNAVDAGFKHFFDILESGQKIDWTNMAQSKEESVTKHEYIEKNPRVLVPKVFMEPDSDPEDVINEILTQKSIERLVRSHSGNNSPKGNLSESREWESPEKLKKQDVIPEFSRLNLNALSKDSKFESGINENIPRPSEIETCPVNGKINDSLPKFVVQAIQKDEKVYKKKRLQKAENLTANFTKGPDFYEKSVVLPQIMSRLYARLAYLDEQSNQKKRLILDAGAKSVTTSNANEEVRIKVNNQTPCKSSAKEQIKTIPNFKPSTLFKTEQTIKKPLNTSGIHSLKPGNVKIMEEAQLCTNKVTGNIHVHTKDKLCPNCYNPSTSKNANNPAGASTKVNGVLSPVVLMDDCNKERLRALKQSQMFKDFVLKGK